MSEREAQEWRVDEPLQAIFPPPPTPYPHPQFLPPLSGLGAMICSVMYEISRSVNKYGEFYDDGKCN